MYDYQAKCLRVVDGDTLDLDIDLGCRSHVHERVRFFGIDTPETFGVPKGSDEYERGKIAANFVAQEVFEDGDPAKPRQLRIQTFKDKRGKFGRYLVVARVDGNTETLNEALVRAGLAKIYHG